ncbi:MAG: sigma-70 family RNA polymerase sigma factor [Planctomycetota bacterium]
MVHREQQADGAAAPRQRPVLAADPASYGTDADGRGDPRADLRLVSDALQGNELALSRLADRLNCIPRLVEARIRRFPGHRGLDVQDLAQEVFSRVWPRIGTFRGEGNLEGWIWSFVVRVVYAATTWTEEPREEVADLDALPAAEPPRPLQRVAVVIEGLQRLSARDEEIVVLRAMEKLPYEEIADRLACTERAAKGRYQRAITRLRALLDRQD